MRMLFAECIFLIIMAMPDPIVDWLAVKKMIHANYIEAAPLISGILVMYRVYVVGGVTIIPIIQLLILITYGLIVAFNIRCTPEMNGTDWFCTPSSTFASIYKATKEYYNYVFLLNVLVYVIVICTCGNVKSAKEPPKPTMEHEQRRAAAEAVEQQQQQQQQQQHKVAEEETRMDIVPASKQGRDIVVQQRRDVTHPVEPQSDYRVSNMVGVNNGNIGQVIQTYIAAETRPDSPAEIREFKKRMSKLVHLE